ncbi:MAG: polynucleotide adenylyltransferase PcnB [Lentisphaeraceae bacterium]|nr:polynucleotide adenylyltransferase PcnB [Lentisphaeraceae bacterium]
MSNKIIVEKGAYSVIKTLQDAGFTTYLVGGAVRDFLLGIDPKDYDISTTATPEEVKKIFGRGARIIGRRFRIVHIYRGRTIYEISTFRRTPSEEERKGRVDDEGLMVWRDNEWGTPEEDAFRRDFTANALFMDPLQDGKIIDYCGGLDDIENGIVRSLGDPYVRFEEDPVRMLRALKLVGQYNFTLEKQVAAAINDLAPKIILVSQRRLYEEILKLTYKPNGAPTFKACHESGLLKHLWPELAKQLSSEEGPQILKLLAKRDEKMVAGSSLSRAYSLSLLSYRYVELALNPDSKFGDGWESFDGIDHIVRGHVEKFLMPYKVTLLVSARVRDVLLLMRRLVSGRSRNKTRRHPEFHYAWLLFNTLAETLNWPDEIVQPWKEDNTLIKKYPRTNTRRKKRRSPRKPDA